MVTRIIQATVQRIYDGRLVVRVRRNPHEETLAYQDDLPNVRPGSRIEVERRVNDPYLRFVRVVKT